MAAILDLYSINNGIYIDIYTQYNVSLKEMAHLIQMSQLHTFLIDYTRWRPFWKMAAILDVHSINNVIYSYVYTQYNMALKKMTHI